MTDDGLSCVVNTVLNLVNFTFVDKHFGEEVLSGHNKSFG